MRTPAVFSRAAAKGTSSLRARRVAHLLPNARLGGPMPWVIAIMVALTVLAAGAALALDNMAGAAHAELAGGVTIQIVEADRAVRDAQAARAVAAIAQLPEVAAVAQVPQAQVEELVRPWLGEEAGSAAIPLPSLIDLQLRGPADAAAIARLRAALRDAAPAAGSTRRRAGSARCSRRSGHFAGWPLR